MRSRALADEPSPERGTVRPALSDVLRAPRPPGGEYFGLYLVDKKVGWYFTDLQPVPGRPEVLSVADFVFKAVVGNNTAERRHHEERDLRVPARRPAALLRRSRTRATAATSC